MMLQVAVEEVAAFLERDYYERRKGNGRRNGYKSKAVKIGNGAVQIPVPQTRDTEGPFHSKILLPYVTQADEIMEVISLLYMHGISTRKIKKAIGKFLGKRGLSYQNVKCNKNNKQERSLKLQK